MAEQKLRSVPSDESLDGIKPRVVNKWSHIRIRARNNTKRLIWVAVAAVMALGTYSYVSSPTKVDVAVVRTVKTEETLGATGKVRGEKSVDLGLDVSGVVDRLYVKEGDLVRAGTLLLTLKKADMNASVDASRAGVSSALAELAKASQGPLPSEIRQARAQLEQAISVGNAKVSQAQAHLRDLQAGSRSQDIAQAQAQLQKEKALLAKAQSDYKRTQMLVKAGAVAQSALDDAKTQVDTAQASVNAQAEQVSALKAGSRPSQISEAKASLTEATASRDTSVRSAREALNTMLSLPRSEDVSAARSKVTEAQAELRKTLEMRDKSDLKAPFDGVVADLPAEEGQSVTPGQKLVTFQEIARPIIEVETDEANLSSLRLGQTAIVSADAYPGKTFEAVLYDLGSKVDSDRGTVTIKLRPKNQVSWLRPDLTVDVNIITRSSARRIILPPDAVSRFDHRPAVFVVRDGKATPVTVTTGAAGPQGIVVIGSLKNGDRVIRNSSRVTAGEDVNPVEK